MDCYYHPHNPLLNFCINPRCSLPLCPKCINIHLSQSSTTHEIVSLNEAMASIQEQLQTICNGLSHELQSLVDIYQTQKEEYEPNKVLVDYKTMIQKYRAEAINEINRHYDYLQRELLTEIGTRYSHHLLNLVVPLEEQLTSLEKAKESIGKHDRALETVILVVSQQSITAAQALLLKIKDKKIVFKSQLPRLQDGEGGKLRMTAERVEVFSQRLPPPAYTVLPPPAYPAFPPLQADICGLDRIATLQAHLRTLRYEC